MHINLFSSIHTLMKVKMQGEKQNMIKEEKFEVLGGGETSRVVKKVKRGISFLDLIFRVIAISGTLASAIIMGTTDETLPFFTQVSRFQAQYDDFKSFQLFVIVNAGVCGYLALSLLLSIFHIVKSRATISRLVLIFLDTIMLALLTAGASAASAIVYLAHNGNSSANWFAICQNFQNFCQRISVSLIGSFSAVLLLVLLVILSSIALSRR